MATLCTGIRAVCTVAESMLELLALLSLPYLSYPHRYKISKLHEAHQLALQEKLGLELQSITHITVLSRGEYVFYILLL